MFKNSAAFVSVISFVFDLLSILTVLFSVESVEISLPVYVTVYFEFSSKGTPFESVSRR